MCRPVECMVCKKTTWAGCGQHIPQVRAMVAPENWCTCTEEAKAQAKSEGGVWNALKRTLGGS